MSSEYEILKNAQERMIEHNRQWLEKNGLRVVQSTIEDNPKYGYQLIIIIRQSEIGEN